MCRAERRAVGKRGGRHDRRFPNHPKNGAVFRSTEIFQDRRDDRALRARRAIDHVVLVPENLMSDFRRRPILYLTGFVKMSNPNQPPT
jgi:hypothetical protein